MRYCSRSASLISLSTVILLVVGSISLTHCKKFEVSRVIIVKTEGVSEITMQSSKVAGSLVDVGSTGVNNHGFCWSLSTNPAEAIDCNQQGQEDEKVSFSTVIEDLTPETKYYFWAYASLEEIKTYGDRAEFTTLPAQLPVVGTITISEITSSTAMCEFSILSNGGSPLTGLGLCWGKKLLPSLLSAENHTEDGDSIGNYTGSMTGLTPESDYYVRAYATNSMGTAYGDSKPFGTPAVLKTAEVETGTVTEITSSSAKCGYSILSDGGSPVSGRGLCWGKVPLPTLDNAENSTNEGSGTGTFTGTMSGLTPEAEYNVRAYATNGEGTVYGDPRPFGTPPSPMIPELETNPPQELTEHSVVLGGSILHEGYAEILAKGIYWSLAPNPTAEDNILPGGSGASSFQLTLGELSSSTGHYYRAFAENSAGIGIGAPLEFKTLFKCGDLLLDERDDQAYPTVEIGGQCWMAKNLNVGLRVDIETGQTGNDEIEKFCYDDNPAHCNDYGGLYTWDEMMQYSTDESAQGVCPDGWHIPSDGEWMTLEAHLAMDETDRQAEGFRGDKQGGMLKTADKPPWEEPNTLATNSTQFSALPSGMIYPVSSTSGGIGSFTVYWVSSHVDKATAFYRMLHTDEGGIGRFSGSSPNTTSVRCVRD